MTFDYKQMLADREAGTQGTWRIIDCDTMGDRCTHYYQEIWNAETDILVTTEVTRAHNDGGIANMRRIARVPDMEAEIIRLRKLLEKMTLIYHTHLPLIDCGWEYETYQEARAAIKGDDQ